MRLNLGCSDSLIEGFIGVDKWTPPWATEENFVQADLRHSWPWGDGTVEHIRAHDILEHLPDKIHTMNEIYRVLAPNGTVEIVIPTTEGRGADQDPNHCSYWNRNSFFYHEHGNPHYERFHEAYGIKGSFWIMAAKEETLKDNVTKLAITLATTKGMESKPSAAENQEQDVVFSILHATAHRLPFAWVDTWREWSRKAVHPERHEYIVAVHESDMEKARQGAESIPDSETGIPIKIIAQPGRYCTVDNWNQAAVASKGKVLIMGADDFFPPEEWDTKLLNVIPPTASFNRQPVGSEFVLHVSTGSPRDKDLIVHPIMSRGLFKKWGYFLYPQYEGVYCDDDLTAHAKSEGVVIDARHIKFDHRNPILKGTPLNELDEGYKAQNRKQAYEIGKLLFDARVQSGFRNDVIVIPRKTIAVCLPGERFSATWMSCWTQLLINLMPKYNIIPLFAFSSNVYITRCVLADTALTKCERSPDYVLWIDDDNLVTTEQVAMLIDDLEQNPQLDMVVGWSWILSDTFELPARISCGIWAEDGSCKAISKESMLDDKTPNLLEIEWTGFPLVLMRRETLEKVGPAPFSPFPTPHVEWGFSGEDTSFCRTLKDKGGRIAVDKRVKVPHLKLRAAEPLDPASKKTTVEKEHSMVPTVA